MQLCFGRLPLLSLLALFSAGACSTLVGADFDGLSPRSDGSGGRTMAGSAGKDTSAGSQNDGGRPTSGGAGGGDGGDGVVIGGTKGEGGGPPIEGGMGGEGGASGSAGAGGPDPIDPLQGVVLLNELKGQGDGPDFLELFNTSDTDLDLGGYFVGDDSINNKVTFPPGASIAAHGFVVVRLQQPLTTGQVTTCYDNFTPCYEGEWGISSSTGESIYFRNAKNRALDTLHYPSLTSAGKLLDGQSLGRFPDGTEAIGAVTVSPGVPNTQPLPL